MLPPVVEMIKFLLLKVLSRFEAILGASRGFNNIGGKIQNFE